MRELLKIDSSFLLYHKFVLRGKLMDKTLKEKLIDSTFEGLDKVIENEYKHHPNENSYSLCRLQEGYNDYLKIIFRKGK